MRHGLTRTLLALLLLGALSPGRSAAAAPEVKDNAHLFSDKAVREANDIIKEVAERTHRDVVVETYATIPPEKQGEYNRIPKDDKAAHNRFFVNWLEERARAVKANGVFILICKKPGHVQVEAGDETRKHDFTREDSQQLSDILAQKFGKNDFDGGLIAALEMAKETLETNTN